MRDQIRKTYQTINVHFRVGKNWKISLGKQRAPGVFWYKWSKKWCASKILLVELNIAAVSH